MALMRRTHPTEHHRNVWTRFETCLDELSFTAAPLICIFGLVRLFLFNEGSGFYSDNPVDVGLSSAILVHRIGWALLIVLSHKRPKLCRLYYYYEMLAMVLDSVLSLSNSTTLAAYNFTLLYIQLINVLVFCAFYTHMLRSYIVILVHAFSVYLTCLFLLENDIWPPAYQQVAVLVIELIMVSLVHLIVTRIGFWYV